MAGGTSGTDSLQSAALRIAEIFLKREFSSVGGERVYDGAES
jgi:hypothetical protein